MKKSKTLIISRCGITAALYVALTYVLIAFAYGVIQIRISEGLTVLPLIYPESIIGLTLGCIIANIASPYGFYDILIGSAVTLVAAVLTFLTGKFIKNKILKIIIGGLPPILLNAFILPLIWMYFGGEVGYWTNFVSIIISQSISVYGIGIPLYFAFSYLKDKGIKGFD